MDIEKELSKESLLEKVDMIIIDNKFKDPDYIPTKKDWPFIIDYPNPFYLKQLFFIYFLNKTKGGLNPVFSNSYYEEPGKYAKPDEFYVLLKAYAKGVNRNLLEGMAYKYLPENIKAITKFIMEMELFSPKRLFKLMENKGLSSLDDINPYIKLLSCFRPSYSSEDLEYMRKLIDLYDNLRDSRSIVLKKSLLGNEKMVACCPCGHKFDSSIEYCEKCGRNPKGLNNEEVKILTIFRTQIQALDNHFHNVDRVNRNINIY